MTDRCTSCVANPLEWNSSTATTSVVRVADRSWIVAMGSWRVPLIRHHGNQTL